MNYRYLYNKERFPIFGFGIWRLGGVKHADASQDRRIATPAQVALNWITRQPQTLVYLMSLDRQHLKEKLGALDLDISPQDLHLLDELEMPEENLWPQ